MHPAPAKAQFSTTIDQPESTGGSMKHVIFSLAGSFMLMAPAYADPALATSKNCMACHANDKKLVGPSFKDIAAKYAGDKTAVDKLATKIQKGGAAV
jgi:cytochrome c